MNTILAIDPGLSGGVAVARFGKTECYPMPDTQGDLLALLRDIKTAADVEGCEPHGPRATVCVLEDVNGFAGKAQPGSAMFRFGENVGFIKGVVQALGIKLVLVRPQTWQKGFGLGTASGCASKGEWKNKLKAEAQRRFPHLPVTLKTADALLILEYSLRGESGISTSPRPPGECGVPNAEWGAATSPRPSPPGAERETQSGMRSGHLSPALSPKGGEGGSDFGGGRGVRGH